MIAMWTTFIVGMERTVPNEQRKVIVNRLVEVHNDGPIKDTILFNCTVCYNPMSLQTKDIKIAENVLMIGCNVEPLGVDVRNYLHGSVINTGLIPRFMIKNSGGFWVKLPPAVGLENCAIAGLERSNLPTPEEDVYFLTKEQVKIVGGVFAFCAGSIIYLLKS